MINIFGYGDRRITGGSMNMLSCNTRKIFFVTAFFMLVVCFAKKCRFKAFVGVGVLIKAAECFACHGNARKLQVPEHRQNHHRRAKGDDAVHAAAQPQEAADTA